MRDLCCITGRSQEIGNYMKQERRDGKQKKKRKKSGARRNTYVWTKKFAFVILANKFLSCNYKVDIILICVHIKRIENVIAHSQKAQIYEQTDCPRSGRIPTCAECFQGQSGTSGWNLHRHMSGEWAADRLWSQARRISSNSPNVSVRTFHFSCLRWWRTPYQQFLMTLGLRLSRTRDTFPHFLQFGRACVLGATAGGSALRWSSHQ
jgi:hypothetical protein